MKKDKVIPTSQCLQWIFAAVLVVLLLLILNHFHITPEMILNYQPASLFTAAAILILLHAVKIMIPLLSIAVLQIAAGHLFPTWIAFLVNSAGILMSVTVPYWIGRRAGVKAIGRLTDKYPHFQVLLERQQENAWFFCFFIRVIGLLPADLVTMYIGATHTPFLPNLLAGSLGFVPGMILATLVGSSIRDPSSPVFWVSIALSALLSVVSAVGYHVYQNYKQNKNEVNCK